MNVEAKINEKTELLDNLENIIEEESLSITLVRNVVLAIVFSLVILFPKIYISSEIYIKSLKINKLLNEYYSLKAENSLLTSKIEKIKFKNRITKLTF